LTVILVTGLAVWLGRLLTGRARLLAAAAIIICVWWNLGLMVQFGTGLMDRQRLDPAKNAYTTFITVPRLLPGIVYRYVFDRQSFYRTAPQPEGREPQ
jgi:hypothetical protein